jgi:carbonic anhydrase
MTSPYRPQGVSELRERHAADFLGFADVETAVKDDVKFLKDSKAIKPDTVVSGWIYHVETGETKRVI